MIGLREPTTTAMSGVRRRTSPSQPGLVRQSGTSAPLARGHLPCRPARTLHACRSVDAQPSTRSAVLSSERVALGTEAAHLRDALILSVPLDERGRWRIRHIPLGGVCDHVTRAWTAVLGRGGRAVLARAWRATSRLRGQNAWATQLEPRQFAVRAPGKLALRSGAPVQTVRWRTDRGPWRTATRHATWMVPATPGRLSLNVRYRHGGTARFIARCHPAALNGLRDRCRPPLCARRRAPLRHHLARRLQRCGPWRQDVLEVERWLQASQRGSISGASAGPGTRSPRRSGRGICATSALFTRLPGQ
jgi:hypothetical protein